MRGTGAFFITPKENFRHLMSRNPRDQKLRMATQDYTAKIYGEWREGVGFWLAEAIFAYIPDELLDELAPESGDNQGL
jgi:predicted flavoprotein YhiN